MRFDSMNIEHSLFYKTVNLKANLNDQLYKNIFHEEECK